MINRLRVSCRAALLAAILFSLPVTTHALTHIWSGAVNGDWSNPGNWSNSSK